ncbi:MAG: shikimate kinase [Clostridia bacterium]|nr:shikimate kinase [Clostridia bacterium]
MNIILSGFMGSGKTTVSKILSDKLSMDFIDLDELITEQNNMSVSEIFEKFGEKTFREFENNAVKSMCDKQNIIIATGGGTLLNADNSALLKKIGTVVFLDVSVDTVIRRLENDTTRPLLQSKNKKNAIEEMLMGRMPIYRAAADVVVDANNDDPSITADEIIVKLNLDK